MRPNSPGMQARECDVAVVGGGSAGMAAAVAAARAGRHVVLLERYGFLGGSGSAALVHSFCGLYHLADDAGAPPQLANHGLAAEIAERMQHATGLGPQRFGRVWVLPQHPVEFVRIADQMTAAETGLELLLHTEVVAAGHGGGGWAIEFACRGRRGWVRAHALVDASGDAVLAPLLGAPAPGPASGMLQRPAYVVGMAGVAAALHDDDRLRVAQRIVTAVRERRLEPAALGASFRSSGRPGEVFVTIDLDAAGAAYDPCDPGCLAALETAGRRVAAEILEVLRNDEPAWRKAWISHWPARAGVRQSRAWHGRHRLSAAEWLAGTRSPDDIALATWPMEFRRTHHGPKLRFPDTGRPCGIPLRCLEADGFDHLWVAGRCISVDPDVQASVRVMGTCFATGEAAGEAAAR